MTVKTLWTARARPRFTGCKLHRLLHPLVVPFFVDTAVRGTAVSTKIAACSEADRALADGGPQTADELAAATGCQPRLVREWLNAQVASAYCEYDQERGGYSLTQEQAACLADPTSPTFLAGGALVASSTHKDTERVRQAFTADGGITWDEHHPHL
ncbi:MAG: hypothetical protein ACR2K0_05760, partial [Acidimicrobiales bacterium]